MRDHSVQDVTRGGKATREIHADSLRGLRLPAPAAASQSVSRPFPFRVSRFALSISDASSRWFGVLTYSARGTNLVATFALMTSRRWLAFAGAALAAGGC